MNWYYLEYFRGAVSVAIMADIVLLNDRMKSDYSVELRFRISFHISREFLRRVKGAVIVEENDAFSCWIKDRRIQNSYEAQDSEDSA